MRQHHAFRLACGAGGVDDSREVVWFSFLYRTRNVAWVALFAVALSPLDPIASSWDEVALGAVALAFLWHRLVGGHRAEH